MNILFIADIYGSPGRKAVRDLMPEIVSSMGIDFVVANVENAAAGFGVTKDILEELKGLGVECMTSGNHIWDRRESMPLLTEEPLLLRPHNYPPGVPGSGSRIFTTKAGVKVGVLNLMGRVFMRELEDPFRTADREVAVLREQANIILLDFHAEATAEKIALGWYLDGRVSALLGTHTHIQTADERILPKGTGYITDAGMTGPFDSVIGVEKEDVLERFLSQRPRRFRTAEVDARLNAVLLTIAPLTGRAESIVRIELREDEAEALR